MNIKQVKLSIEKFKYNELPPYYKQVIGELNSDEEKELLGDKVIPFENCNSHRCRICNREYGESEINYLTQDGWLSHCDMNWNGTDLTYYSWTRPILVHCCDECAKQDLINDSDWINYASKIIPQTTQNLAGTNVTNSGFQKWEYQWCAKDPFEEDARYLLYGKKTFKNLEDARLTAERMTESEYERKMKEEKEKHLSREEREKRKMMAEIEQMNKETQAEIEQMNKETEEFLNPTYSDKSRLICLLLAIFLGFLGAHRFYVKRTLSGVLFILTGGGFCILWILDLLKILSGNFKDANGHKLK